MSDFRRASPLTAVLGLALGGAGCSAAEDPQSHRQGACAANETVECACANGALAIQTCLPSGDAFGPCQCSGDTPTAPTGGPAVGTGGTPQPGGPPPPPPAAGTGGAFSGGTGGAPSTGAGGMQEIPPPTGGTAGTPGTGEPPPPPLDPDHCLSGITNYTTAGPFRYTATRSGSVNIWVPDVPAGCKVPMAHLANGTGARCSTYGSVLQHLASHGFLTACYENTNTGQGTQCLTAIQTMMAEYPDLADNKVGSTGHSQGGGGAVMCVYRAEQELGSSIQIVGHAMEPAHGFGDAPANYASLYAEIRSPIFMFNGSRDTLVSSSWVGRGFSALDDSVEAYWYEAVGAAHIPIPARWTEESTVAWFRWKLLGDTQACEYFKNMPNTGDWTFKESQSATECH